MRRLILIAFLVIGCARAQERSGTAKSASVFPPERWWRQSIAHRVGLSGEQRYALDSIETARAAGLTRIERETASAVRNLNRLLASDDPSPADVAEIGRSLGRLSDERMDNEVQRLGEERRVLSREQWNVLQNLIEVEYPPAGSRRLRNRQPHAGDPLSQSPMSTASLLASRGPTAFVRGSR